MSRDHVQPLLGYTLYLPTVYTYMYIVHVHVHVHVYAHRVISPLQLCKSRTTRTEDNDTVVQVQCTTVFNTLHRYIPHNPIIMPSCSSVVLSGTSCFLPLVVYIFSTCTCTCIEVTESVGNSLLGEKRERERERERENKFHTCYEYIEYFTQCGSSPDGEELPVDP